MKRGAWRDVYRSSAPEETKYAATCRAISVVPATVMCTPLKK